MDDLLTDTIRAISSSDDHVTVRSGPPDPAEQGWTVLSAIEQSTVVDGWYATTLANVPNGARDVAGSYLASFAADAITVPIARALRALNRGILLDPATTWVRQNADGWFDGVAFDAEVMVLRDDVGALAAGAVVADGHDELMRTALLGLIAALEPLFAAVRARAPYGLRGMWGAVADSMSGDATWTAHVGGADVVEAWQEGQRLIDTLAHALAVPLTRPTLSRIERDGHVAHLSIRGTCCLYYKSVDQPPGEPVEYCTSCPLGTDDERRARQSDWLVRDLAERA